MNIQIGAAKEKAIFISYLSKCNQRNDASS